MTDTQVKCAIVGLGRWGRNLVTSAAGNADAPLRFVRAATRTPAKAEDFCAEHDLPLCDDYREVLADPEVEAVVFATPHSQHHEQVIAAAEAGKHIFVEKPFALTLGDAREMTDAAAAHRRCLAVGFNRRFMPAFREMRDRMKEGAIGKPLLIEGQFSGPWGFGYSADMWRGSAAENPAGGMAAMGIHVLDAMIALMGPVAAVRTLSRTQALESDLHDTTVTLLDFASGAAGTLTTLMASPTYWRLHVAGTEGWIAMPDQDSVERLDGDAPTRTALPAGNSLGAELSVFARAIRGGANWPIPAADILAGVAAMQAIGCSAERGGEKVEVTAIG
ncbi:gfo/Idh/MocA family oxidoreductase [Roseovarius spongiae]|uniref:Gfo/Idh/MocA family oxidoreductase n=1 Tax=Roseovarius spongiae TaxID=2320272 RepID=A0A3A8B7R4_9RHOB|nr:Gfo/Idh/MocA family oxidoreductase [Roseovarius spongiae]RKF12989.1 gfo/Idh/MocA family oxidoreductase [Roseovarius spongiae]